jgi:hypothetical protein
MHSKRLQDKAGHFVSTVHPNPPTTSQAVETTIRTANIGDLTCLVLHRRAMFEEMGYRDAVVLNEVEKSSRDYCSDALRLGTIKARLAEDGNGRTAGAAESSSRLGPAIPAKLTPSAPGF